jgi:hypothetical protein
MPANTFTDGERTAMTGLFETLWLPPEPDAGEHASAAWRERERLCEPVSRDFILNESGYHSSFTYATFVGRKPA